jgi:ribosomal protein S4
MPSWTCIVQESEKYHYLIYHIARITRSMSRAKQMIEAGEVKVNDVVIKDTFYRVPLDEADISVVLQGKIEYIKIDLAL